MQSDAGRPTEAEQVAEQQKDAVDLLTKHRIPEFRDAGREDCFCSEQDHPEFSIQEEGQSRGTESPKRRSVSTRKTDRVHDLRLVSSD